jgi:alkanesulfonate monooxygenase SsuD/methylene tetrahydromethanopterin reductase-like flavin-dependent oxidoreductase (luciferase family)
VIFQAGDSSNGRDLAAEIAEATFVAAADFDAALSYRQDVRARAAARGRNPDHVLAMPGLNVVIEDTDEAAQAREASRIGKLDFAKSLVELGRLFNYHDFRQYDPDAPFPDTSKLSLNSYKGMAERVVKAAREHNLTLRQTAERFTTRHSAFVGTAQTVAAEIERWFAAGAIDGFILHSGSPEDFRRFTRDVVPILQSRGLFRTAYEHATLRGHLGLPVPANRYAAPKALAAE